MVAKHRKIKLRPKAVRGVIVIKILVPHPMETGFRKINGKILAANHITNLVIFKNDNKIIDADIGGYIAQNPYFKFLTPGKKGDMIKLWYEDNRGQSLSITAITK